MGEIDRLRRLLDEERLTDEEVNAFADMLQGLTSGRWRLLTEKQEAWLRALEERYELNVGDAPSVLYESGKIPRGNEVPVPAVLRDLPKAPPRRRSA